MDGPARFERSGARMRKAALAFGVVPHAIPTIERAFADLLERLGRHFEQVPCLLGPSPTVADYGLYAPPGPHLGHDPHPSMLIRRTAPRTWRRIERMAAPLHDLLARCGLASTLALRCRRRVERRGHLEVRGPPRA